jgi:hypothetical protein
MSDFTDVVRKAISHKATLDTNRKDVKDNTILISKREEELKNVNEIYRVTKWSYSYLDTLVKEESGKFIKRLNDILDYGVKTIFYDCDYSVEIRVSDNNKATIHLVYDDDEGNKLEPDIQSCGGGIRTVIGLLLQVFFIFHYRVEKIIMIDEGLSQVSSQYLPNLFSLINELAVKNGMKILLITHDNRMLPYGTSHWEIQDGKAIKVEIENDKGGEFDECDSDTTSE